VTLPSRKKSLCFNRGIFYCQNALITTVQPEFFGTLHRFFLKPYDEFLPQKFQTNQLHGFGFRSNHYRTLVLRVTQIKFDYDFESYFPQDDPDLDKYIDFRNTFEYDNEFILLAIENKEGIFREEFLDRISVLTDSIENIPDVSYVQSPVLWNIWWSADWGRYGFHTST
jgi:hypothetical protein